MNKTVTPIDLMLKKRNTVKILLQKLHPLYQNAKLGGMIFVIIVVKQNSDHYKKINKNNVGYFVIDSWELV
jgi:hypothetical protein